MTLWERFTGAKRAMETQSQLGTLLSPLGGGRGRASTATRFRTLREGAIPELPYPGQSKIWLSHSFKKLRLNRVCIPKPVEWVVGHSVNARFNWGQDELLVPSSNPDVHLDLP